MPKSSNLGKRQRQRRDGTFTAKDGFGRSHVIEVYTEVLPSGGDGLRSYLTADGESVERLGKGTFRVNDGGQNANLHSDDPAAH
jgi:hypothetical protein